MKFKSKGLIIGATILVLVLTGVITSVIMMGVKHNNIKKSKQSFVTNENNQNEPDTEQEYIKKTTDTQKIESADLHLDTDTPTVETNDLSTDKSLSTTEQITMETDPIKEEAEQEVVRENVKPTPVLDTSQGKCDFMAMAGKSYEIINHSPMECIISPHSDSNRTDNYDIIGYNDQGKVKYFFSNSHGELGILPLGKSRITLNHDGDYIIRNSLEEWDENAYDIVKFKWDGNDYNINNSLKDQSSIMFISPLEKNIVTVKDYDFTVYIPSEWKDLITINETSIPAVIE